MRLQPPEVAEMKANDLVQLLSSLVLYALGCVVLGLALFPGAWLTLAAWQGSAGMALPQRALVAALAVGTGFFLYGFTLMALTAFLFRTLNLGLRPGAHPYFSAQSLKWVLGSSLHLVVKVTFMDFLVLSPFLNLWFQAMGAKLGQGVLINSKYIHDLSLLEIGDGSVIGGEAVISCHAAEGGKVLLSPVKIGRKCLIGQRAILMPGVEVGDGAVVGAQALVLKGERIPPGEVWVGIPARKLED